MNQVHQVLLYKPFTGQNSSYPIINSNVANIKKLKAKLSTQFTQSFAILSYGSLSQIVPQFSQESKNPSRRFVTTE